MVRPRNRNQVVRSEDEVLPHLLAALDLPGHQAGDVEHDLFVIDGRYAFGRGADLNRDVCVGIGQLLHPGSLAERKEGKGHQRTLPANLAGQRAVEIEQVALRAGAVSFWGGEVGVHVMWEFILEGTNSGEGKPVSP